jgi:hypothetical protein
MNGHVVLATNRSLQRHHGSVILAYLARGKVEPFTQVAVPDNAATNRMIGKVVAEKYNLGRNKAASLFRKPRKEEKAFNLKQIRLAY